MSGIYIPGISMPEDGWHKVIKIFSDGTVVSYYDSTELGKAIPVPDHGRLIDASELLQSIKEARKADPEIADVYDDDYFLVAEWVCSSPTIIPAEEGQT